MNDAIMNNPSFPYSGRAFRDAVQNAVEFYWSVRLGQARRQRGKGKLDAGTRGEVTGGRQLDAFAAILERIAKAAGFSDEDIFFGKHELPVPGFYRAQKKWDFAVCRDTRLIAAIEFKSQSGSFGNNFNTRTEEVLGLARDFWISYREKAFGLVPQPWLGYLFLLEESEDSAHPVELMPSRLPPLVKFEATSYQDRYRILCETLVLERDFSAAALLTSRRPKAGGAVSFSEPLAALSAESFFRSLFTHLAVAANV